MGKRVIVSGWKRGKSLDDLVDRDLFGCALAVIEQRETIVEIHFTEPPELQPQKQCGVRPIDRCFGSTMKLDEMGTPVRNPSDEKVGRRVHGFDGESFADGQLHQRKAVLLRPRQSDDVEIFGGARGREPRCSGSTANQQPFSNEAGAEDMQELLDSRAIEARLRHDGTLG